MNRAVLLTALLIVLAGCGGVMSGPVTEEAATASPTATPATDVSVIGGDLPFDADAVFEGVLNLTGYRVSGPVVYVEPPEEMATATLDNRRSQFRTALGIVPPKRNSSEQIQVSAYAPADGDAVHVNEEILRNETSAEVTMAHEFVHVVQSQNEWSSSVWFEDPSVHRDEISYDGELTYHLVIEGAAEYTEDRYGRQYIPEWTDENSFRATYRNGSAYERLNYGRYVLGAEYVADRVDSPRELERVHRHPPRSTEQVLHNSTDPVEPLTVTTTEMGNWTERGRDRQGELFLRIALRTELNKSTAVDAAAGWGEDRRITFERDNRTASAWALHWDDAENATEFESAFDRYLDARATQNGEIWEGDDGNATYRVVEANDETTVVLLGDEEFVRTATVNATQVDVLDIGVED